MSRAKKTVTVPEFSPAAPIVPHQTVESERMAADESNPEIIESAAKNAFDPEEPIIKSGFAKVRISNFRGGYGDAHFNDDGLCERISHGTLDELLKQFPGVEIAFAKEIAEEIAEKISEVGS